MATPAATYETRLVLDTRLRAGWEKFHRRPKKATITTRSPHTTDTMDTDDISSATKRKDYNVPAKTNPDRSYFPVTGVRGGWGENSLEGKQL